jgi:hypothetical protein
MNLNILFQTIGTLVMVSGVIFSLINLRNFQASRKRESAIVMLNSFQTNDFVRGLLLIFDLPDGADTEAIEKLSYEQYISIYMVLGTWERLGILVYRREIALDLVDDAFSGPILQTWQKLAKYSLEFRARIKRETAFEWFQWLAERMAERETTAEAVPAYIAHRNWKARKGEN